MFETLTNAQIADTLAIGIIGSVIATLLIMSAAIIFKPFNNIIKQAREWWVLKRQNSPLNIEVTLSGSINPINSNDFDKSIKTALSKIDNTRYMRSEGGFRLYSNEYVYLCQLIQALQLFGYSLEEIKKISDYFRDFLSIQKNLKKYKKTEIDGKLESMLQEIKVLFEKMKLFKAGIQRWEDLLKKKRKEILNLRNQNQKRSEVKKGKKSE